MQQEEVVVVDAVGVLQCAVVQPTPRPPRNSRHGLRPRIITERITSDRSRTPPRARTRPLDTSSTWYVPSYRLLVMNVVMFQATLPRRYTQECPRRPTKSACTTPIVDP